jgi:hypothetical protein
VRVEPADTRNKPHLQTVIFISMFDQPIKQLAAVTFRLLVAFSHEVFNLKIFAASHSEILNPATALISRSVKYATEDRQFQSAF